MRVIIGLLAFACCAPLLLSAAGCGRLGASPIAFNQAIASANKRIATDSETLGSNIGAVLQNDPTAISKAKASYQKVQTTFREVKSDMAKLQVPPSDSAKKLYELHQKFL